MKNVGILFLVFLLFSCGKTLEKPSGLISKEKMRNVLIEVGLSKNIPKNLLDPLVRDEKNKSDKRLLEILSKNNINLEDFRISHKYYTMYPEEYQDIFRQIKDSLNIVLDEFKFEDSIAELNKSLTKDSEKLIKEPTKDELKKIDRRKKDSIMKPINMKLEKLKNK